MSKVPLAKFLSEARVRSGYSQKKISRLLGYKTPQFISNWERGVATPPGKILHKLSELYNVLPEKLYEVLLAHTLQKAEEDLKKEFFSPRLRKKR